MSTLFQELRQRKVFRVAAGYAFISWAFAETGSVVFPEMLVPDWVFRALLTVILLGFPIALIMAWALEWTPEGIRRTRGAEDGSDRAARRIEFGLILVLSVFLVAILGNRYVLNPTGSINPPEQVLTARLDPSIAVLPFVNMSSDPEQEYFSDGISEELLNLLAKIPSLKVVGRTSSFAFKGQNQDLRTIGEVLGVAHVLEGSVRKADDTVRITAQLVRTSDGFHLWSETYDRQLTNIFAVQDEISGAIVEALKDTIFPAETELPELPRASETNVDVFELYLGARAQIITRQTANLEDAKGKLMAALELDRSYPPALAAMAEVELLLADNSYGTTPLSVALKTAKPFVERALVLDPNLAEAHAVKGLWYRSLNNYELSNVSLDRALELNPSLANALNWRAINDIAVGKFRNALIYLRRAADADPLWILPTSNLVQNMHIFPELRDEVRSRIERFLRFTPDSWDAFTLYGQLLRDEGKFAESVTAYEKALALAPQDSGVGDQAAITFLMLYETERAIAMTTNPGFKALFTFASGDHDAARAQLEQLLVTAPQDPVIASLLAFVEDSYGNGERVIELLTGGATDPEGINQMLTSEPNDLLLYYPLLISAYRARGDDDNATIYLTFWRRAIDNMSADLTGTPQFDLVQARLAAFEGDHEQALRLLTSHAEKGGFYWIPDIDPAFRSMQDNPGYLALFDDLKAHIAIERTKAGLDAS